MLDMLSKEDIQRLASLSKLHLEEDKVEKYTQEIIGIIDFVEELQDVDTEGIDPTYHGNDLINIYREDEPVQSEYPQAMIANAPDHQDGFVKVPVIIESEEV